VGLENPLVSWGPIRRQPKTPADNFSWGDGTKKTGGRRAGSMAEKGKKKTTTWRDRGAGPPPPGKHLTDQLGFSRGGKGPSGAAGWGGPAGGPVSAG